MDNMNSLSEFLNRSSWVMPGLVAVVVLLLYWIYGMLVDGGWGWEGRLGKAVGIPEGVWSSMTRIQRVIVRDVWASCNGRGVRFLLHEGSKAPLPNGDSLVSGYFMGDDLGTEPTLCVAVGKDSESWVQVLMHESSHMDQWSEGTREWMDGFIGGEDVYDIMFDWLDGKREMTNQEIEGVMAKCMALELDCEKRTVEKLLKYGMGDTVDQYVQKANSYVWAYYVMRVKGRWYVNPPYEVKAVWERMPKRFMGLEDYFRMDWETMTYFTRFCFLDNRHEHREGVEL